MMAYTIYFKVNIFYNNLNTYRIYFYPCETTKGGIVPLLPGGNTLSEHVQRPVITFSRLVQTIR